MIAVEEVHAEAVELGDVVWAPDDGDWLNVKRIENDGFDVTLYRSDGSLAAFDPRLNVLRRTDR